MSGFSQDRCQQRLVKQMTEVGQELRGAVLRFTGAADDDVPKIVVQLAVPSGEAGSSWPGADDTTLPDDATVAKVVGEARLLGISEPRSVFW